MKNGNIKKGFPFQSLTHFRTTIKIQYKENQLKTSLDSLIENTNTKRTENLKKNDFYYIAFHSDHYFI